ncbi:MAG: SPOR domain-containing protein [Halioglobus sp.]
MNEVLKQRLVGALILVALGVVFWPIIFVEPGEQGGAEEAQIPPRPLVETTAVEPPDMAGLRPSREIEKTPEPEPKPQQRELLTLAPEAPPVTNGASVAKNQPTAKAQPTPEPKPQPKPKPAPKPMETKTRSEAPVKPALDADGIPITWILRVASVSSAGNADKLRKDLLDMGHKAYVKKITSNGKTLYRVYVGPKAEKARLQKIQGSIDAKFGVTTLVTRYYP